MRKRYAAFEGAAVSDYDDMSDISNGSYGNDCRAAAGLFNDDLVGTEISLDDEEITPAGLSNNEVTEEMILNSVRHVRHAKAQRAYLQMKEEEAINDAKNNVEHSERRYCWQFDYCMNVECPHC